STTMSRSKLSSGISPSRTMPAPHNVMSTTRHALHPTSGSPTIMYRAGQSTTLRATRRRSAPTTLRRSALMRLSIEPRPARLDLPAPGSGVDLQRREDAVECPPVGPRPPPELPHPETAVGSAGEHGERGAVSEQHRVGGEDALQRGPTQPPVR